MDSSSRVAAALGQPRPQPKSPFILSRKLERRVTPHFGAQREDAAVRGGELSMAAVVSAAEKGMVWEKRMRAELRWQYTLRQSDTMTVQSKRKRKFDNDVEKRRTELEFNNDKKKWQAEGNAMARNAMFEDWRRVDAIVGGQDARSKLRKQRTEIEQECARRIAAVQQKAAMRRELREKEKKKAKKDAEETAKLKAV